VAVVGWLNVYEWIQEVVINSHLLKPCSLIQTVDEKPLTVLS